MSEASLRDQTILITGGLGFIGSHLTRALLAEGARVRILDSLLPQVHGQNAKVPAFIEKECDVRIADVRNREAVRSALEKVDGLVHLAAETGTGQSMYSASYHFEVNTVGTAMVLEEATAVASLRRMVLASSRAVYGEGAYTCAAHGFFAGESRRREDLAKGLYDVRCPKCEQFGTFALTPEHATLSPQSIYGVSKYDLEKTTHMIVRRADQQASVMRFQNVYGPGQSLINPYTGILAIFSSLAKRNEEILVFEDGDETRDFVFIEDTVASIVTALRASLGGVRIFNVGTGVPVKVVDVARRIAAHFQSAAPVTISRFSRAGDIRHNGADMTRTRKELGFDTKVRFEDGLKRFLDWTMTQNLEALAYRKSLSELEKLGAVIRADAS